MLVRVAGESRADQIRSEVGGLHRHGVFHDGEVMARQEQARGRVRGDKITWVTGSEPNCASIGQLVSVVDSLVAKCNNHQDAGQLASYNIKWRTRVSGPAGAAGDRSLGRRRRPHPARQESHPLHSHLHQYRSSLLSSSSSSSSIIIIPVYFSGCVKRRRWSARSACVGMCESCPRLRVHAGPVWWLGDDACVSHALQAQSVTPGWSRIMNVITNAQIFRSLHITNEATFRYPFSTRPLAANTRGRHGFPGENPYICLSVSI